MEFFSSSIPAVSYSDPLKSGSLQFHAGLSDEASWKTIKPKQTSLREHVVVMEETGECI
jgi:hypothetical protein